MKISISSMAVLICMAACQVPERPKKILALDSVGLKTKEAVDKIIGLPDSSTTITTQSLGCQDGCIKAFYLDKQVEIIYINGIADWIIVTPKEKVLLSSLGSPLELIGGNSADQKNLTFQNENVLRYNWKSDQQAPQAQVFVENDVVKYYHVKLITN